MDSKIIDKKDNSVDELLKLELNKRITILKEFLDDETIEFILKNNYDFINRISIISLLKSAKFYTSLDDVDYKSIIKWFPILLDYDRFNVIYSYLKDKKMNDDEIVKVLEGSVYKDFELADILCENKYDKISTDYLKKVETLKNFDNKSKIDNETFNNLLDKNMQKYNKLLGRLK